MEAVMEVVSAKESVVGRLRELARAADDLALADLADQLSALESQIRRSCNISAAAGPASTSAAAAAPPKESAAVALGPGDGGGDGGEEGDAPHEQPAKKLKRAPREFDFSRFRTRYVALELLYVGWGYMGFARQDNTDKTIEAALFSALRKVKLIPEAHVAPISELRYSRCGRTDRGVSALGQVVALVLRSSGRAGEPEPSPDAEYDYPRLINKVLPPEIRVLGWAPVPEDFNARFSAQYREYKYFIVQQQQQRQRQQQQQQGVPAAAAAAAAQGDSGGGGGGGAGGGTRGGGDDDAGELDIPAMRAAAAHFVGEHDFRNFCKPDVAAVRSFRRTIRSFTIDPVATSAGGGAHRVYALTVRGTAFLWHQVRCMAAVLLMVGRRQEAPDVVRQLLDVAATPCKPQYSMAPEEPLLLYSCGYLGLAFRRSGPAVEGTLADVASLLHRHLIGAALTAACHGRMAADERNEGPQGRGSASGGGNGGGGGGGGGSGHIPLMRRQREPSIEERMARRGLPWPPTAAGAGGAEEDDAMLE